MPSSNEPARDARHDLAVSITDDLRTLRAMMTDDWHIEQLTDLMQHLGRLRIIWHLDDIRNAPRMTA